MDRRTFLRNSLAAAGALGLAACSKSSPRSQPPGPTTSGPGGGLAPAPRATVRFNQGAGDIGLPNPFAYSSGPGYGLMSNIYDSLVLADFTFGGPVVPWLASRYDHSSDGMAYTFDLRDNVQWQDGQPLTPDDIVFSFEYFAAKQANLQLQSLLVETLPQGIVSVKAVGARSVEIRLDHADVPFLRNVAGHFPIVPRHVWSGIDDPKSVQDAKILVGTGPYRLDTYTKGQGAYLLTANDGFFLGKPFVKRIEENPVGDELAALKAGAIDVASAGGTAPVRPDALAPFRADPSFGIREQTGGITGLYWNLRKGGALADPRFRQACAKAINRNDLVQRVLGGNGKPGNPGYLPPSHPYYANVEQYAFDPAGANQLLDGAGYKSTGGGTRQGPDGQPLRFQVLVIAALAPIAEILVAALKAIGVELTVQTVDQFPQVLQALSQGSYEMAVIVYGGNDTDPDILRAVFSSKTPKTFFGARGYTNPELDDLANKQRGAFDDVARRQLISRMQEIIASDLPLLHLYYPSSYFIYRKAAFDQWPAKGGPDQKQVMVTGKNSDDLTIRPTTG